jgi:polyisoprenoid-binding protein YceI
MSAEAAVETRTWKIDSAHSMVDFSVKHMIVSTVKGSFQKVEGEVQWDGKNFETASVEARIDTASVTTYNEMRDNHLRTNDFFNSEQWPVAVFKSTGVKVEDDDEFILYGDLTIRDVTRPIELEVEFDGLIEKDGYGGRRAGFTAKTTINRNDFGVTWNGVIEGVGVAVSEKVKLELNLALVPVE